MASNTENLNLLMKNPSTDGADTFNVQTMLNENWQKIDNNAGTVAQTLANILKPTTPPIIGLPPSTTPDGMFQALGNTGELHVWRKTVTEAQEQPAGFTLGDVQTNVSIGITVTSGASLSRSHNINVSDAGVATLDMSDTYAGTWVTDDSITTLNVSEYYIALSGKPTNSAIQVGDIYYVPSGGAIVKNGFMLSLTSAQKVNAHGIIPSGTTTTYPVSTNPNAYQEGSYAKPEGYTLGEVVTGKFAVSFHNAAEGYYYKVSGNIDVSSSGSVSMPSTSENVLIDYSHNNSTTAVKNKFAGKFVQFLYRNGGDGRKFPDTKPPFNGYDIVYIPDNVSVTQEKVISNNDFVVDRYQPVTGHAAIPAGTTIEYLGKLGDKARVQVVSYVGTGTYGSNNPNSLTFDFVPKLVIIRANGADHVFKYTLLFLAGTLTKTFQKNGYVNLIGDSEPGLSDAYARVSGRTLAWYAANSYNLQANYKGAKYTAVAIG